MRVVFMGTPDFAAESAAALKNAGHELCAVFTQPDKPKNRGKQVTASPVKEFAVKENIPVYQPLSLRKGNEAAEALAALKKINPDVIVVVAYGQILPKEILMLPRFGCVNVHASLLPKYRGAAPIQRCIQDGCKVTGVCTMRMDEGLDTGDVILRREVEIPTDMTGTELWNLLAKRGAELICRTLEELHESSATFTKQPAEGTYAKMITKEELHIDFNKTAKALYNFIRAMADIPCAYTILDGKRLKIYRAHLSDKKSELEPGTVVDAEKFSVVCGDGLCIELTEVQPEGGKRMSAEAFLRGKRLEAGTKLEARVMDARALEVREIEARG